MPEQERFARKQSKRSKGGGSDYEQALVDYLEERIRPGLNRGAIPLLARSIASDIANGGSEKKLARYLQERIKPGINRGAIPPLARSIAHDLLNGATNGSNGAPKPRVDDDEDTGRAEDDGGRGDDDAALDFENEMHDLQGELGEEWVVSFSVFEGDAWLTAEKTDGTQHIEAPTASVLRKAARLLDRRGGRSG